MDEPHTHAEEKQAPPSTNDSDIDDAEPQAKRARPTLPTSEPAPLTRKNLALFNKMGKEKSSDPSDDSGSATTISTTTISTTTISTTTISTTSPGFVTQARRNGILDPRSSEQPPDLRDLYKQLVSSQETPSPPKSAYSNYVDQVKRLRVVPSVVKVVILEGSDFPIIPLVLITRVASFLAIFAHHTTLSEKGTLEYHQYPIKSINLVNSYEGYKEGRRLLRNAQDRAREQSHALKEQLKEYYDQQRGGGGLHPVTKEVPPLPVPGIELVEHKPVHQPMPPTSSKHSKSHHSHSTPHSSKAPSSTHSSTHSSSGKRKASSSQSSHDSSRHISKRRRIRSYWKQDRKTGRYYHYGLCQRCTRVSTVGHATAAANREARSDPESIDRGVMAPR
ncbi:hypothetical protein B0T16DRAFT_451177 [Cercophora newfieldiana]|uniref:Uncharacterized protein n=1 Tax=Cercophora newfieldiana TaxID=92897 RepID=A0AA39YMY9_9PEZI|nr:hypothetical protein B0T16DRAFT_451177 [Cercophora newfieldiana]